MNILPVNSADNYYSSFKAQTHCGLWSKSNRTVRKVFDNVYERCEQHFHPCLDANASDLRSVIEKHEAVNGRNQRIVFVDMRMPITMEEFEKYFNDRASMSVKDVDFIDQYIKNNNLSIAP